jgi:hypothetical protein
MVGKRSIQGALRETFRGDLSSLGRSGSADAACAWPDHALHQGFEELLLKYPLG